MRRNLTAQFISDAMNVGGELSSPKFRVNKFEGKVMIRRSSELSELIIEIYGTRLVHNSFAANLHRLAFVVNNVYSSALGSERSATMQLINQWSFFRLFVCGFIVRGLLACLLHSRRSIKSELRKRNNPPRDGKNDKGLAVIERLDIYICHST